MTCHQDLFFFLSYGLLQDNDAIQIKEKVIATVVQLVMKNKQNKKKNHTSIVL